MMRREETRRREEKGNDGAQTESDAIVVRGVHVMVKLALSMRWWWSLVLRSVVAIGQPLGCYYYY